MTDRETWGTLVWERRDPVLPRGTNWRLPNYENATPEGGVVYRLRFLHQKRWRSYIGLGSKTARERLAMHLSDKRPEAGPQQMMQEHLLSGTIEVWTLSRTSTLAVLGMTVTATGIDKFNLLLFEAAAVVYAATSFRNEELLNRPTSLPPGTHKKSKLPVQA